MTIKNNWGAWLDSEIPSPGVISANKVNMEFLGNEICLDCEQIHFDIEEEITDLSEKLLNAPEEERELLTNQIDELIEAQEYVECFDHTMLFGDWKKDEDGKYIPDETGEFAAIYTQGGFNDITVVWSKFTTRGTPCSPCAPKCVSIPDDGETGEFMCYTLPKYLLEEEDSFMKFAKGYSKNIENYAK